MIELKGKFELEDVATALVKEDGAEVEKLLKLCLSKLGLAEVKRLELAMMEAFEEVQDV